MTDPPMYNVASAVLCRSLAIVRSLPLPGCVNELKKKIMNSKQSDFFAIFLTFNE